MDTDPNVPPLATWEHVIYKNAHEAVEKAQEIVKVLDYRFIHHFPMSDVRALSQLSRKIYQQANELDLLLVRVHLMLENSQQNANHGENSDRVMMEIGTIRNQMLENWRLFQSKDQHFFNF
ncbi:unnamed protein product [Caenorhabditis angaria]|uniref:Uncharacterized protein n=1 Tax=Caenorhabditis angaria TaxID=860376 RepID=A0A9P1N9X9_9PELO|nr:unnamed protein product [Caenorhabditis angaria]